ncbi:MAG TPA: RidA family protein [Clostridia bacterium]|nr:RidA family protein [Clostridia bacterium]
MKKEISTTRAPAAVGPYSQAVKAGNMVFTSGQLPINPQTGQIPTCIEAQAEQAFQNLVSVLDAAQATLADVVKTTVFVQDLNDFAIVNEIYAKYFKPPCPARSCIEAARLPKGVLIEVEAIAIKD